MSVPRGLCALVLVLLTVVACAQRRPATPAAQPVLTPGIATVDSPTPTTETPLQPAVTCTADYQVATPAPAPITPTTPGTTPPGDVAPHEVENNRWKQRRGLSLAEVDAGRVLAEVVGPALKALCDAGDFEPAHARQVLADLGHPEGEAEVARYGQIGVAYSVSTGRTCVFGYLWPGRFTRSIDGHTGEGTCIEPFSH
ncbi:hypothetical protein [Actinosynnema sp. NPDC020468]|uniref:hypothetical protein n=1 Tax=Actinosynnema sp. NPDC020468 TaxID=3154488 RepID=UPI0033E7C5D0